MNGEYKKNNFFEINLNFRFGWIPKFMNFDQNLYQYGECSNFAKNELLAMCKKPEVFDELLDTSYYWVQNFSILKI